MCPTQESAAGFIVFLLIALVIHFMLPEIRRYSGRERM